MDLTMAGKTVLITGANSGIGLATAKGLAAQGARVVMMVRSAERGEAAQREVVEETGNRDIHVVLADLSLQSSIRAGVSEFLNRFDRLDVLLNNAALVPPRRETTAEGLDMQFAINHMAYFLLADLLLPTLTASAPARIVNVSSNLHANGQFDASDVQGLNKPYRNFGLAYYATTKLYNHLFTFELARRLEGTGVTVNCVHPGVIATRLSRAMPQPIGFIYRRFLKRPSEGAQTSIYLASSPDVEGITGKYWVDSAIAVPAPHSMSREDAAKLWSLTQSLVVHSPLESLAAD